MSTSINAWRNTIVQWDGAEISRFRLPDYKGEWHNRCHPGIGNEDRYQQCWTKLHDQRPELTRGFQNAK